MQVSTRATRRAAAAVASSTSQQMPPIVSLEQPKARGRPSMQKSKSEKEEKNKKAKKILTTSVSDQKEESKHEEDKHSKYSYNKQKSSVISVFKPKKFTKFPLGSTAALTQWIEVTWSELKAKIEKDIKDGHHK